MLLPCFVVSQLPTSDLAANSSRLVARRLPHRCSLPSWSDRAHAMLEKARHCLWPPL